MQFSDISISLIDFSTTLKLKTAAIAIFVEAGKSELLTSALSTSFSLPANNTSLLALASRLSKGLTADFPAIQTAKGTELNNLNGVYIKNISTIFLNQAWLNSATNNDATGVLLEELGHHFETILKTTDTTGDEGENFSLLVRGISPSQTDLNRINNENDTVSLNINAIALTGEGAEGTAANDNLAGTDGADALFGYGGNDTLSGSRGDDVLYGDIGNDSLDGGARHR
ncbi:hypothetical protein AAF134_07235 [Synechococcus lacustris Tous-12m]